MKIVESHCENSYPKGGSPLANLAEGGDAVVTLGTGELSRARGYN